MSTTYLCPACQGRGYTGVYSGEYAISTTTCLTCAGKGSIGAPAPEQITEWEYDATCPRCGMGRRFSLAIPPDQINPVTTQMLAAQIGCPRSPRICGTLVIKETPDNENF